jgi:predicted glycoside hydrolase/deacetylase ChbG (UPF0249 family)
LGDRFSIKCNIFTLEGKCFKLVKYLIINGDDFGLSESVNLGILSAHKYGSLSSTSIMVNMPHFEQAVTWARQMPTLGVGLHFNITEGAPITPFPQVCSLINDEGLFSAQQNHWTEADIEHELLSQYTKLLSTGIVPTHVDSHHHVHIVSPIVHQILTSFCRRLQLPYRKNPNIPEPLDQQRGLCTDQLILDTYDSPDRATRLISHLNRLPDGRTEIMCHPGHPQMIATNLAHTQKEHYAQFNELRAVTDQRIPFILNEQHIQLIHYGQLAPLHDSIQSEGAPQPKSSTPKSRKASRKRNKNLFKRKLNQGYKNKRNRNMRS